ncbi:MAG TPA: tetratricopeptide repeat protein [Bryobacteraceae bacterium]|nr:tetratricopeptide repeat protein [Bryobacteraceae bacterium]
MQLNPQHTGARLKLAELMAASHSRKLVSDAAAQLEQMLAASPENAEITNSLAIADIALGKREEAGHRLEGTLRRFPANLQSSVVLAKLKLQEGDLAGAEGVLQKATAAAPHSGDALLALGELHLILNQPDKSEVEMREAVQVDSKNDLALLSLAELQLSRKRIDEADHTFRQVAALPDKRYKPMHAAFLYVIGKRNEAVAEFARIAEQDPDDVLGRNRLLWLYVCMDRKVDAEALLKAVLKRNPKDSYALLVRGDLSLKSGNLDDAEADLNQIIRYYPDSALAYSVLANIHRAKRLRRLENDELGRALQLDAKLLEVRFRLAENLISAKQGKAALDLLNRAPAKQKQSLGWVIARNWAWLSIGDFKSLEASLAGVREVDQVPELVLQRAFIRMARHDYEGSRMDAEKALRKNPEDVRAARLIAETYTIQKEVSKAVRRLVEISSARPGSAQLQFLLAEWEAKAGDVERSRAALEAAKRNDPGFVTADLALAQLDRQQDQVDSARQRLTAIIVADPKNTEALLALAEIEGAANNRSAAIFRYREVLKLDAANLTALNNLSFYLAWEDPDAALKVCEHAVELAPDDYQIRDTLGWVYYRKGDYRHAVQELKWAVAKEPTPQREFHLAMSYLKTGERDLGSKELQAALRKDPNLTKTEVGW